MNTYRGIEKPDNKYRKNPKINGGNFPSATGGHTFARALFRGEGGLFWNFTVFSYLGNLRSSPQSPDCVL